MRSDDYSRLLTDVESALLRGARSFGLLGLTSVALRLSETLRAAQPTVTATIYAPSTEDRPNVDGLAEPYEHLTTVTHDVLVVTADAEKEDLLLSALPHVRGMPTVLISGYAHFNFSDPRLDQELARLLVPSLANGYPNSIVHLFQCLGNAARLGLEGTVAEFGMFKGGTTMLLSRMIERLGMRWRVVGFDTFAGFPARRSLLDMYAHPGCVFTDLAAVRRYLADRDVEIVSGDIVDTCHRLDNEDLVLTFMDTDNYTPARAALEVVRERTVRGGAIVFDHFVGDDRFNYTLGERIAGKVLLDDPRYFNLHGTGVFYRQR